MGTSIVARTYRSIELRVDDVGSATDIDTADDSRLADRLMYSDFNQVWLAPRYSKERMLDHNLPGTRKCRSLKAYVRWAEYMKLFVWSRIMVAISVAWLLAVAGLVGYEYTNYSVFCRYDGDGVACQQIFWSWDYAAPGKFEFTMRYCHLLATSLLPVAALWLGVSEFLCHQSDPVGQGFCRVTAKESSKINLNNQG